MNGSMIRRSIVPAVVALISAALSGCGDLLQEPDTGIVTNLALMTVSGDGQTGLPGATLPQPVRVRLVDLEGRSTERLWVEWIVVQGSGTVELRHSFTDADGVAETTWTLGPGPERQRIEARIPGDTETFEANLCQICPEN